MPSPPRTTGLEDDAEHRAAARWRRWVAAAGAGISAVFVVAGVVVLVLAVAGDGTDWGLFALGAVLVVLGLVLAGAVVYFVRPGRNGGLHPLHDADEEDPRWSSVKALVVSSLVSGMVLALTVVLLILLDKNTHAGPESALSLVFVAAAVVLILVVCTLTIVLKRLKLVDSQEAMGLPRGSIRAVIALMLVLLFFIAAIFLFNTSRRVPPTADEIRTLQGVDPARLATIPVDQIRTQSTRVVAGATVYDVQLLPSALDNQTSDDLAKQLITVLGTLVTAVAAFYFGANSVSSALKGQVEVDLRRQKALRDAESGSTGNTGTGGTGTGGTGTGGTGGGTGNTTDPSGQQ